MPARLPLEAMDRLAEELLAQSAPMRFDVARSPVDLEAIYRMRYRCAIEQGWCAASDFPDGLERDRYDDYALQIAAWATAKVLGTNRLVFPAAGRRLPTEEAFDLEIEPRMGAVDVGRLVVDPSYRRDPLRRVAGGLIARSWLETRARGFDVQVGVMSRNTLELWRARGLEVVVLGAARRYWGENRYPIRISATSAMAERWRRSSPLQVGKPSVADSRRQRPCPR
jgi:N-acyl-L-homoserine lactone synthetase